MSIKLIYKQCLLLPNVVEICGFMIIRLFHLIATKLSILHITIALSAL